MSGLRAVPFTMALALAPLVVAVGSPSSTGEGAKPEPPRPQGKAPLILHLEAGAKHAVTVRESLKSFSVE